MPKKRFNNQFSKPASTVHPSLKSGATGSSSSSNQQNAALTVNSLINKLRSEAHTKRKPVEVVPESRVNNTLPPDIRQLLNQVETPAPRPRTRVRRRFDENGRLVPAGPPPPESWLRGSTPGPIRQRDTRHIYPSDVDALPGMIRDGFNRNTLQDTCLRSIARNWEIMQEYEKYNLAGLETRLRMMLLSYIAVYGPNDGIGYDALKHILAFPEIEGDKEENGQDIFEFDAGVHNKNFTRLDISGSMGYSISFKQLTELVREPEPETDITEESWEDSFQTIQSISPLLPHLTHLSLSHPSPTISWPKLLAFVKHVPTLTHLSLAYWPVPSSTPNSSLTKFVTDTGREVQYGGTSYYSHLLDDDYIEAAGILRRLSSRLYSLEYLDLTGCTGWCRALRDGNVPSQEGRGVDWGVQWPRLRTLVLHTGKHVYEESTVTDVVEYRAAYTPTYSTYDWIVQKMRGNRREGKPALVAVQIDDLSVFNHLWRHDNESDRIKRRTLEGSKGFD